MTIHLLCLVIALVALAYAGVLRWRNEAERRLAERDEFING